jgi:hypothetical protein
MTAPSLDDLNALMRLIDGGQVKVGYTATFPLEEAQPSLEAHQQREPRRRKVVLKV